jgi:ParB-like chromosome segregation protein Spo0J
MPVEHVVDVPVRELRFGLSPRAQKYDPDHVAALAEVLPQVPPIVVHGPTMRVIDGVHRAMAARSNGHPTIPAVMFEGDDAQARIEAVRSNVAHGKPLSLAERQAAAVGILELAPDWSDRRVANASGLSPKTVARLRERAAVDSSQLRVRVGRDGKMRPINPSAVRQRVAEAIRSEPMASNRAISKISGASQATVRDVRERLNRGMSETSSLEEQRRRRQKAADAEPRRNVSRDVSGEFSSWFESHNIGDTEWKDFVDAIPISRVYEVADAARQRSDSWRSFAGALEERARGHRRSAP